MLRMFDPDQRFQKIFLDRFLEGHIACVVSMDDQPVHVAWIAFTQLWIDESKWSLQLAPSTCCIYNVETLPQFRRQGIYSEVLLCIAEWWWKKGGTTITIYADMKNRPSILGILNAGFRPAGEMRCWIAFNKFVFSRPMDLRIGNVIGTIV